MNDDPPTSGPQEGLSAEKRRALERQLSSWQPTEQQAVMQAQGESAARNGRGIEACPVSEGDLRDWWLLGWAHGQEDADVHYEICSVARDGSPTKVRAIGLWDGLVGVGEDPSQQKAMQMALADLRRQQAEMQNP